MMKHYEIRRGNSDDAEKIIEFADYVFSKFNGPHDFATLLPKLYGKKGEDWNNHYLIENENGKLIAMLCAQPVSLEIEGESFTVVGIGTVAVHPNYGGQGLMSKLMNKAVEDMKLQNIDFTMLGGQRQRYEYFGYQPAGIQYEFSVDYTNLKHLKQSEHQDISLQRATSSEDVSFIAEKSKSGFISFLRKEDMMIDILKSWNGEPHLILKNGKNIGYVVLNTSNYATTLYEIKINEDEEETIIYDVLKLINKQQNSSVVTTSLPEFDPMIGVLSGISQSIKATYNRQYRIFNYDRVVLALMRAKACRENLADYEFSIKITAWGILKISVISGDVEVEKLTEERRFDLELDEFDATSLIFSPLGEKAVISRNSKDRKKIEAIKSLPQNWFPLPLFTPLVDCV